MTGEAASSESKEEERWARTGSWCTGRPGVSEDTEEEFVHTHGEAGASESEDTGDHDDTGGDHAGHGEGQTFGPEIGFQHTFEGPGAYKV